MRCLTLFMTIAFSGVLTSGSFIMNEVQRCTEPLRGIELVKIRNGDQVVEPTLLEEACPVMLGFLDCLDSVSRRHTGVGVADLTSLSSDPNVVRAAELFRNLKSVLTELCEEGTDLNDAYKRNLECFETITYDDTECSRRASNALSVFRQAGVSTRNLNEKCVSAAYKHACFASDLKETCGQDAFDFYQSMVKRSSVIRLSICSQEQLELVKTSFMETLELEESQKDLFRLAFDLRRRKK